MTVPRSPGPDAPRRDRPGEVRVLVVDDQRVFRQAAREVIDATGDFALAGEAASGEEALAVAAVLQPDLIILDVRMPGMGGAEVVAGLRSSVPESVVVLISVEDRSNLPRHLPVCGAAALVRKQDFGSALLQRLWAEHGRTRT